MEQILNLDWNLVNVRNPDIGVEVVGRQSDSVSQVDTVRPVLLILCDKRRRVEVEDQL